MRWIIKNPAPSDSRQQKWGDYHFGRSLAKYLKRLGHEAITQYDPHWEETTDADVVIVLRGKYSFSPEATHGGALRVLWNISHPRDVTDDECETYDLVLVASRPWAKELGSRISRPVLPLLQCTDLEEFSMQSRNREEGRRGFVFIGNTRDVERPGVLWALDYGLPLEIWGRGWEKYGVPEGSILGDYFPNEDLGRLYARSRVTFNDHWPDMKEFGFVNNRIFDAVACGLPVISDWHEELESLLPGGVLLHRDRDEFRSCIETVLLEYPRVQGHVQEAAALVRAAFSFEQRVADLDRLVAGLAAGSRDTRQR